MGLAVSLWILICSVRPAALVGRLRQRPLLDFGLTRLPVYVVAAFTIALVARYASIRHDSLPARPMHVVILPSGKQIKAFEPGVAKFGDDSTCYDFSYLTSLPLSLPMTPQQRDAAATEADEVWAVIRPDVEKAGFKLAHVGSQNSIASAHGACFSFKQSDDGTWSRGFCGSPDEWKYAKPKP